MPSIVKTTVADGEKSLAKERYGDMKSYRKVIVLKETRFTRYDMNNIDKNDHPM